MNYLGIDIGGTKCAVLAGDESGRILEKVKFPTAGVRETLDRIIAEVGTLAGKYSPERVGISCGGPLDAARGVILSPPNLPGWDEIYITDMIKNKTGLDAYLCNDANACALAEWKFGAGVGCRNMIFLTFGTGMGAGLILDGRLYAGTSDTAGEVGHIRLSPDGPVGYGKAGSFEGFCSGGGIAQLGKRFALEKLQTGVPVGYCGSVGELENVTAKSVADAARAGDPTATEVYNYCGERLGQALSILIDVLNPERIIIGSIFERSGELLYPKMRDVIERETLSYARRVCEILPAKLGDSIGDYAALAIAVNGRN